MDRWPQSLRSAVGTVLNAPFPMVLLWGPAFTMIYNNAYSPILGAKHPDALGRSAPEVWPEAWPTLAPLAEAVRRDGRAVSRERDHFVLERHGTPEDAWFTWSFSPVPDESGGVGGLLHVAQEDTARVRAEDALRESEERLRTVFEQTQVGIAQMDPTGRFVLVNQRVCEIVGRSQQELLSLRMQDITHHDDLPDNAALFVQSLREGTPFAIQKRYLRPDGSQVWVSNSVSVIRGDDGSPSGVIAACVDITDRRRAEEARRMVEFRFQRLVEYSPQSTQLFRPDGGVWRVNRAFTKLFGITLDQLWDYNILRDPELVRLGVMPLMERAFAGEAVVIDPIPYVMDRGQYGGQTRWVGAHAYPVADAAGQVGEVVLVHFDVTERKQAEERLRRAHDTFYHLIQNNPFGIYVVDADFRLREVSLGAQKVFAHVPRPLLGRDFAEVLRAIWAEPFASEAIRLFRHTLDTGEPYASPRTVEPRQDIGAVEAYDWRMERVVLPDGRFGVVCYFYDLSERQRWEAALRESEERHRRLIETAYEGIWTIDAAGRTTYVNQRMADLLGYAPTEMMGRVHTDFMWEEDRPKGDVEMDRRRQGTAAVWDQRYRRKDGGELWTVASCSTLHDADGKFVGALGMFTDITDRKRAEAGLRASEERLHLTADAIPALIAYVDAQRRYQFVNAAYGDWFGVVPERMAGRPLSEVVGDAAYAERRPQIDRVLSGESVRFQCPMPHARLGRRETETSYVPDAGEDGSVRGFVVLVYDVTERMEAEREREQLLASEQAARAEAERASRMKDDFLATLSHELRTPLNAILGWSQILANGTKDVDDLSEGLRTIERNARAQTQIIEDLLDMSRIVSGKIRLDVQRLDLAAVVQAAVDTMRPAADAKGVRLQVVIDPKVATVSGDPGRLHQVFWNLISNAIKFTPKAGRVQVLLERVNSHLEFSVIDTGEGIRAEFLPSVFDRFKQGDASTTRRHGGLGLGLSIVRQLVELHGGSVRAASPGEGRGATFTVTLPLMPVHAEHDAEHERRHPQAEASLTLALPDDCSKLKGVRVLVVDDEADSRALVKRLLEDCEASVVAVASAAEAMEVAQRVRPDVLVSDIGMPGEDGYSLIQRVRALGPDNGGSVPALALTAYARAEDRVRAVRAGFQTHVVKPVEPAELITMVASLAGRTA
jgi:PAS domain S-box-containing protein